MKKVKSKIQKLFKCDIIGILFFLIKKKKSSSGWGGGILKVDLTQLNLNRQRCTPLFIKRHNSVQRGSEDNAGYRLISFHTQLRQRPGCGLCSQRHVTSETAARQWAACHQHNRAENDYIPLKL